MNLAYAQTSKEPPINHRGRVIIDNDFGGDPDGLFQAAHHLLSPSVEIRGIIASRHYEDGFYGYPGSANYSLSVIEKLLETMECVGQIPVLAGAEKRMHSAESAVSSPGARLIIDEALRDDVNTPLFVTCGAGLTNVASALLIEPKIADKLTVVWIGGPEYPELAYPPPGPERIEYNLGIDPMAAQAVFNASSVPIWQVPRNAYRQTLCSYAELNTRIDRNGKLGGFLMDALDELRSKAGGALGETYVMGDNPLVLLSALQSSWEIDPCSSLYTKRAAPKINDSGYYTENPDGREIRVYTNLDTRLMFEDMYAKFAIWDK